MYGFINICVKQLVLLKFGEDAWKAICQKAVVDDSFISHGTYDDGVTLRLVQAASDVSGIEIKIILELFGEYFFTFCQESGYDEMLQALGGNLKSFLENLDSLHSYLSFSYKAMEAPSFRCERRPEDNALILHYYSHRKGLHPIVVGIVRAVARELYKSQIKMEILAEEHEEERNGKKEHVTFAIFQKKITQLDNNQGISVVMETIVANSPKGICPVNHKDIKSASKLMRSFVPAYPEKMWITQQMFCEFFPFHIIIDDELRILQAGAHIQRVVPRLRSNENNYIMDFFDMLHPQIDWHIRSIKKFINMQYVLQTKRDVITSDWLDDQPMLQLRGQMVCIEQHDVMAYICSPRVASLKELEERNLHLSDIPFHDVTRDLILFNHQRLAEIELGKQLEQKKEELRSAMQELGNEKMKTDMLLHSMLPRQVADQLREGKRVEAGEFEIVTILFSDIVSFTNICAECRPIDIVNMLNSLYTRFDMLTSIHDVYKVETIGDAYMVVGGLPIPASSHAARISNMALGMMRLCKEVISPVSRAPIGIRVGLHSGPVVAGVVGEKMPRYCLFGDTVNTASRMESHGLPHKIHMSNSSYDCVSDMGFEVEERGEIMIKGKGLMRTYFLLGNNRATIDEIIGKGKPEDNSSITRRITPPEKSDGVKALPDTTPMTPNRFFFQRGQQLRPENQRSKIPMKYVDLATNVPGFKTAQGGLATSDVEGDDNESEDELVALQESPNHDTGEIQPSTNEFPRTKHINGDSTVDNNTDVRTPSNGGLNAAASGDETVTRPPSVANRPPDQRASRTCTLL